MNTVTVTRPTGQVAFPLLMDTIRRLAAEQPDRTAACVYVNWETGNCECIVGVALDELGVELPPRDLNTVGFWALMNRMDYSSTPLRRAFTSPTPREVDWVAMVQSLQDGGNTWQEAVRGADINDGISYPAA